MHQFDRRTGFLDTKAFSIQNVLIDGGMEITKARTELHFLAVDSDRSICPDVLADSIRKILRVDRQEPGYIRAIELEPPRYTVGLIDVNLGPARPSEEPQEQIKKSECRCSLLRLPTSPHHPSRSSGTTSHAT